MELLLNDNWAGGRLEYPEDIFSLIGDKNKKLSAKQDYEFLLRAAKKYPVTAIGCRRDAGTDEPEDAWEDFRTDCYITGKYQQELLDTGYFNPVIETLLENAARLSDQEAAVLWLEKMISRSAEYYEIDDNTAPVLIYLGADTCFNTLNHFSLELKKAFLCLRQQTEVFDAVKEGHQALTKYIGQHFKAIIGIQTYLFSIKLQDGTTNLHDLISGAKYNMILDHPAWMKEHICNGPIDYYLLIHDRNYISFADRYYENIKGCLYVPPAGTLPAGLPEKLYDITFIGSYRDYRERLATLYTYDRKHRHFAGRYIGVMKKHPDYTAEQAFGEVLSQYGLKPERSAFLDLFYEMRQCCFCIMLYYREKVVRTLLEAGLEIHVYSESWQHSPFADFPNLICHPELQITESLQVMQQSRISLNIMSWHKDGLTERILNAMLCQSVMVSDRSTALEEQFTDGRDLVLFSLAHLEELPLMIKGLLKDENKLEEISRNGYEKARREHLWLHRARQLLNIWDKM